MLSHMIVTTGAALFSLIISGIYRLHAGRMKKAAMNAGRAGVQSILTNEGIGYMPLVAASEEGCRKLPQDDERTRSLLKSIREIPMGKPTGDVECWDDSDD